MEAHSHRPVSVAVIGGSGYTGVELLRLLLAHPGVAVKTVTSRQHEGKALAEVYPSFIGKTALRFSQPVLGNLGKHVQTAFLCLPHHESVDAARRLREKGVKVIDLSADFRFKSARTYEKTYGEHAAKGLLKTAAYGLCEIFAEDIKKTSLVGVPGCYVTSILLALAPLVQNQLISLDDIICDSKSGVSGAGRKESVDLLAAEIDGDFKAYGLGGHRHQPEIEEKLAQLAGSAVKVLFTPHLLPVARGILSTVYARPLRKWQKPAALTKVFESFYRKSRFVKLLPSGASPRLKAVVGTNECHLSVHYDDRTERVVVLSALDNLIKGAAGQAVQCFNLMYGFAEDSGLELTACWP